jgi:flavorubredoxin
METRVDEVAPEIYRLSTYIEPANFTFNQYLVNADQPLLFHTGGRQAFPLISEAAAKVLPLQRLRWISFGHYESDECGSMNEWLAAAPDAQVVHGQIGVMTSLNDMADRAPRSLTDGETLDLGSHRVRWIDTANVPHGWDSGLLFEETTATLFCGDLFTAMGAHPASTDTDVVGPAAAAEDIFAATALTPSTGPGIRRLADLQPTTLGLMHGPAYIGDGAAALRDLADDYDRRLAEALQQRELVSA